MTSINLPPDLEQAIEARAQRQGTTPEVLIVDKLREQFLPMAAPAPGAGELTMADFFAGYIGGLRSSEYVPGGAQLSTDSGHKFTDLLLRNRRKG